MAYGFGVDLGGTAVKIAVFDGEGSLLSKWEIPTRTERSGAYILPDIAASILAYCKDSALVPENVLGVGIGVPGAVTEDGVVNHCVNLGWGRVAVCQELERLTGFFTVAGNDATLAALGECWRGSGKGCRNMLMVTLGTGMGSGIIANGKLLPGAHGAAGEIGHIVINREEPERCTCGRRGCAEQYCSATGIVRLANRRLFETDCPSSLRGRDFSCKDVFDAAREGDVLSGEVLEDFYSCLGNFLADVCCVTDPEMIVLGGGVSKAGFPLLEGVKRHFEQACFHACREVELALATLGNDAGVYGGFKLLLDRKKTTP